MPAGDGTGPMGMGPRTGRGAGRCAGFDMPGFMNSMPGRGMGYGFGRGRGPERLGVEHDGESPKSGDSCAELSINAMVFIMAERARLRKASEALGELRRL